jgi:hypothetical protein
MKAHSNIGASSACRWMTCPGSVVLSQGIENRSSEYALEGTAAHQVAEKCLVDEHDAAFFIGTKETITEGNTIHEIEVTKEMADAVQVYLDFIRAEAPFDTLPEVKFHLKDLHPDLYGTADCVQYFEDTKTLRVTDYKHGMGIPVEAEGNPQGMYYALGALITLRFPARFVEIAIVQPRCEHPAGPIRTWKIDVSRLMDWQADLLDAVKRVEAAGSMAQTLYWEDTYLKAGDHCKFCPAAGVPGKCKAIEAKANALAKVEFAPLLPYKPEDLAQALHDMPAVEARIKAIREFAYAEAEAGRCPPGWKLVAKRANRKWRDPKEAVQRMAVDLNYGVLPDEFYTPAQLVSPAQVEKLLPKDQRAILEELTVRESSGHTLAPAEDKRVAIKQSAQQDFKALQIS